MQIHILRVYDKVGLITNYFLHRPDAVKTYQDTYSKIAPADKPRFQIEAVEVLERSTHL